MLQRDFSGWQYQNHDFITSTFYGQTINRKYFKEDIGKIIVETPLVGGAYGGKASVQLEILAYLGSKAVDGLPVKILNTRKKI